MRPVSHSATTTPALSSPCYVDPDALTLELERIFGREWLYACPTAWLESPGDYVTLTVGATPVVLVRDGGGTLRAFVNVCRHRGSLIAAGSGNRRSLQCPYHAWTYGLDGSLLAAPRADREAGFHRDDHSLEPLGAEFWGPFVFVNTDTGAAPLEASLETLPALVADLGLDVHALEFHERREYEIACNWKVAVENTLECYHCPVVHPSFASLLDLEEYEYAEAGRISIQGAPLRDDGGDRPYCVGAGVERGAYPFIWPNFMLSVNPGPGNCHVNATFPLAPERSRMIFDFFFSDAVSPSERREYMAFAGQVMREDIPLVESVQVGLRSGRMGSPWLLRSSEQALVHFQQLVQEAWREEVGI